MKKRIGCCLLMMCLALGGTITAHAEETKIDKVRLTITSNPEPKSGEEVGDVQVTTSDDSYSVGYAEYSNDQDTWSLGDKPVVFIELNARNGYRFSSSGRSYFSFSGDHATYKRAKIYDSGSYMELEVYLDQINGRLGASGWLEWDGNVALWEDMNDAKNYDVRLYRDERLVTTVTTANDYYDFSGYFNNTGSYTFRVRGLAGYNGRAGEWSEHSDENYISSREAGSYSGNGRWILDNKGWWYQYQSGGYPSNGWCRIDTTWYYFNRDGYMQTGWQRVDGDWYYLNGDGAMLTGWQFINNRWYYLGSDGVMLTDWQFINGRWYYMDASGAMYANTWIPDGCFVDASGAFTGQRR